MALEHHDDPARVAGADAVVLPGVGAFRDAAQSLRASGLEGAVKDSIAGRVTVDGEVRLWVKKGFMPGATSPMSSALPYGPSPV